jgi:hypothetical protein
LHAAGTMAVIPVARPAGGRRWPGGLAWALWLLVLVGVAATAWLDRLLRQAGLAQEAWLVASNSPELMAAVTAATVGAVLASRRPRHPVGWLLLALGLSFCLASVTSSYSRYGLVAAAAATGALAGVTSPTPLYPEHPSVGNPLGVPALSALFLPSALVVLVGVVVGAGSLVGRYRRARGTERLQLRWLALAAALSTAALLEAIIPIPVLGDGETRFAVGFGVSLAVLPLATGTSILRYRLYDLDRIISRTVAYGLLTLLLGLGYAAVVLGLGRLLPQDSSLVVAAATLVVAAAFQPARRRIQQGVDRRFNRRHDATQTIAAFSARLRDQVDLTTLTGELLAVVDQTMQPTQASLWLRPQGPATATDATASHQ